MNYLEVIKANDTDTQQRQRNDLDCADAGRKVLSAIMNPHKSLSDDTYMLMALKGDLISGITSQNE
jgi:hypothetical protein